MDDRALWSRIEGIFHSALERKRAERADYVRTACEGDEDLRLRVESLLAHDDSGSSLGALTGHHLGPYEILAPLGAGGMGEVYRARDTRLDRTVAVKILRRHLSSNPQFLERFGREAQVIASLSHPHICTLHDVGHQDGIDFLVMELIEGESLRALMNRGTIPLRKVVDIAVQIADGMATAHTAGITHRDLKPENVMVTKVGRVKILDFGLARQMATEQGTPTMHDTQPGTVMGTVNYMSPEQASGLPVDYRSDQFAFGLILYELVSGKRAFQRESKAQTLAAIISEEPPPIEAKLPPPLRWMIERCMAKEPALRYESSRDLYYDLRALYDHFSEAYTIASIESIKGTPTRGRLWKWIAIPACLLLAAMIALFLRRDIGQDISRYRYTPFAMNPEGQYWCKWSPDGKSVAYVATVNGHTQVFVRSLSSPDATQLTSNREYAFLASFSRDGKRVLFTAPGPDSTVAKPTKALYSIAVVGGEPEVIAPMPDFGWLSEISPDRQTMAAFGQQQGGKATVFISSPLGSPYRQYEPAPFASAIAYAYNDVQLTFAPNGKKLLLIRTGDSGTEEAWLLPYPPGTSSPRRVLTQFPARKATSAVSWMPDNRHVAIALSSTGSSLAHHLWMADTESDEVYQITGGTASQDHVAVSPNGRQIIYSEGKMDLDITGVSLLDGKSKKLIASEVLECMAAWSAKTEKLAYVTDRNGSMEIWMRSMDGSDQSLITQADFPGTPTRSLMNPVLSPDGKRVIFTRVSDDGTIRTWIKSFSGGRRHD